MFKPWKEESWVFRRMGAGIQARPQVSRESTYNTPRKAKAGGVNGREA